MEIKELKDESKKDPNNNLSPGPGHYNPKFISRNTGIRIRRFKTIDSKKVHIITPGPGSYMLEAHHDMLSQNGGTGKHNGYKISFTKDRRVLNKEVEDKRHNPGPSDYLVNHDSINRLSPSIGYFSKLKVIIGFHMKGEKFRQAVIKGG